VSTVSFIVRAPSVFSFPLSIFLLVFVIPIECPPPASLCTFHLWISGSKKALRVVEIPSLDESDPFSSYSLRWPLGLLVPLSSRRLVYGLLLLRSRTPGDFLGVQHPFSPPSWLLSGLKEHNPSPPSPLFLLGGGVFSDASVHAFTLS